MNEWPLVWMVPFKVIPTMLLAFCYVIGGRKMKWIRRFLGSGLFAAGCICLSAYAGTLSWKLTFLATLTIGLCMGYGGDVFWEKVIRRFLYGLVLGSSALFLGWLHGVIWLGVFQLIIAIQASMFLGIKNPDNPVDEEALIAIFSTATIPFIVA